MASSLRFVRSRARDEESNVPELRNSFHKTTGGGSTQDTNTWTLVADAASGNLSVEHEWSYVDPFGHGKPDCGMSTMTVESFLMGNVDDTLKQKLREALFVCTWRRAMERRLLSLGGKNRRRALDNNVTVRRKCFSIFIT